jgi:ATP-dependent DNA helicase 2 subunit 2
MGSVLRLGDVETRAGEAVEIIVKYSKCTSLARPKGWKRFGNAGLGTNGAMTDADDMAVDAEAEARVKPEDEDQKDVQWRQLKMRTEYYIGNERVKDEEVVKEEEAVGAGPEAAQQVDEEQLVRGFKYGSTYVPCPEGQFPKMGTVRGIDICGFFHAKNVTLTPPCSMVLTDECGAV